MPEFLIELYVPGTAREVVEQGAERARRASDELTRAGTPVRFLRAIFVSEDETCFQLYEAESADAVREAAARAGLAFDRVSPVLTELAIDSSEGGT